MTAPPEYAAGEGEKSELLLFKIPSSEIESPTTITPPFQQTLRVFVTNCDVPPEQVQEFVEQYSRQWRIENQRLW